MLLPLYVALRAFQRVQHGQWQCNSLFDDGDKCSDACWVWETECHVRGGSKFSCVRDHSALLE